MNQSSILCCRGVVHCCTDRNTCKRNGREVVYSNCLVQDNLYKRSGNLTLLVYNYSSNNSFMRLYPLQCFLNLRLNLCQKIFNYPFMKSTLFKEILTIVTILFRSLIRKNLEKSQKSNCPFYSGVMVINA